MPELITYTADMVAFVLKAIVALRTTNKKTNVEYKGIDARNSGFNEAFCKHFNLLTPEGKYDLPKCYAITDQMDTDKHIVKRGVRGKDGGKGSVILYLPQDAPARDNANTALKKMGLIVDTVASASASATPSVDTKTCGKCKASNPASAKFCVGCGKKL